MRFHLYRKGPAGALKKRGTRGSVLVELTLLAPWVFFLFVGVIDLGFFCYSLIAVENSARVAAEYTSKSSSVAASQSGACGRVLLELAMLPNSGSFSSSCDAAPLVVTAASIAGPDGSTATSVSVTYNFSLIPIPGLMAGRLNVTRNVQMRVQP